MTSPTTGGDDVTTRAASPSRTRIIAARTLVVLGVLCLVISLLANFVKREALARDPFRDTSRDLIANPAIQAQVAQTIVDELYTNVDVAAQLQDRLPKNLKPLAPPIAGFSQDLVDRGTTELLARPRVENLFVDAASRAQTQVVDLFGGNTSRLQTTNGNVVFDLRPLVVKLGGRFGFLGNGSRSLPPDAGRITILKSDQLDTAQNITQALKVVADWIWVLVLLLWAIAIYLVPGRRRIEVRAIAIGFIVVGVVILVARRLAGSYLVDNLTGSESVRPAVSAFWNIVSEGVAEVAWVAVVVGVIGTLGAWLTGEGSRAAATRRAVAPWLARTGLAWAVFAVLLLLVVWALPLHRFLTTAILVVLSCLGFEVVRRQVAARHRSATTAATRPRQRCADPGAVRRQIIHRRGALGGRQVRTLRRLG